MGAMYEIQKKLIVYPTAVRHDSDGFIILVASSNQFFGLTSDETKKTFYVQMENIGICNPMLNKIHLKVKLFNLQLVWSEYNDKPIQGEYPTESI